MPVLLAAADRVEADVQLLLCQHELLRRELCGRVFEQQVDHKAAPEIVFEIFLLLWQRKFGQRGVATSLLDDGLDELVVDLGDERPFDQSLTNRHLGGGFRMLHDLRARKTQRGEHVIDQRRIVLGLHGQRVARGVFEAGAGQVDFVMSRMFWRVRPGEVEHALHFRDAGVLDVVNGLSGFWGAHELGKELGRRLWREVGLSNLVPKQEKGQFGDCSVTPEESASPSRLSRPQCSRAPQCRRAVARLL
ncbi:MAG: hypothetical protein NTX35_16020 [Verrucomicrobia bacterium]|nr:hypothetical protein [Verrucomicrobiota bacterium]